MKLRPVIDADAPVGVSELSCADFFFFFKRDFVCSVFSLCPSFCLLFQKQ
jgi:hypothetical protein